MSNAPNIFEPAKIQELHDAGLVRCTKHPTADLFIWNYTQEAQFSGALKTDTVLAQLRGLIVDGNGSVKARGFNKFFNLGEQPDVDKSYEGERFEVEEKLDGSLGIMYHDGTDWAIATRGSFTSDQAIEGTRILRTKYKSWTDTLNPAILGVTHLFEIIYPENRIVVDYDGLSDLVLIGKVIVPYGYDLPVQGCGYPGPIKKSWGKWSHAGVVSSAFGPECEGKEGFVLRYDDGHRVKVKLPEYLRLHRIVTNCNEKSVWEACRTGTLSSMLENVPDEFYKWVAAIKNRLEQEFVDIWNKVLDESVPLLPLKNDRKAFAAHATASQYSPILFCLLDGKIDKAKDYVWKMIEPKGNTPAPFASKMNSEG